MMEKYDIYLTSSYPELYASYCSKKAIKKLTERLLKAKGYDTTNAQYVELDAIIDTDWCLCLPCKKVVARVKEGSDIKGITLCYYVDDSIEW